MATATGGSSGEVVTWQGAPTLFTNANGQISTIQNENAATFLDGDSTIASGAIESALDYANWDSPFQYALVLYYLIPETGVDSASYTLSCE